MIDNVISAYTFLFYIDSYVSRLFKTLHNPASVLFQYSVIEFLEILQYKFEWKYVIKEMHKQFGIVWNMGLSY